MAENATTDQPDVAQENVGEGVETPCCWCGHLTTGATVGTSQAQPGRLHRNARWVTLDQGSPSIVPAFCVTTPPLSRLSSGPAGRRHGPDALG